MTRPELHIIAGPNGAGKTTLARELLAECPMPFLNADEIAHDMREAGVEGDIRISAGKELISRFINLSRSCSSFAIESTLSGRYLVRLLRDLDAAGYRISITFVCVETADEALRRIDVRVRMGGHAVPAQDVIRRFGRSKKNFWELYRKLADRWEIVYNAQESFVLAAIGERDEYEVQDDALFRLFLEGDVT